MAMPVPCVLVCDAAASLVQWSVRVHQRAHAVWPRAHLQQPPARALTSASSPSRWKDTTTAR
jgi:hypothetical protein